MRRVGVSGGGDSFGFAAFVLAALAALGTTFGLLAFSWSLDAPSAVLQIRQVRPDDVGNVGVQGGVGVSVESAPGAHLLRINNTGVTSLAAGAGIALSATTGDITVTSTVGDACLVGGTGISVVDNCTVENAGVLSLMSSGSASVSSSTGDITVGAPTVESGTGITVSGPGAPPGAYVVENAGVLSLSATGSVSVSSSTGAITVGAPTVENGTGIAISGPGAPPGVYTVENTGVLSLAASGSASVSSSTGAITVSCPTVEGGDGITVDPPVGSPGNYTIHNLGVLSVTAGDGITVTPTSTGHITINATSMGGGGGVTSVGNLGGGGMSVSPSTGAVLLGYLLAIQTTADESDPNGPQVAFLNQYGVLFTAASHTWYTSDQAAFTTSFFPGVVPGDDGVGRSGNEWRVPGVGFYTLTADCIFMINTINDGTTFIPEIAFNVGATTNDPTISGFIPYGGRAADQADQWTADERIVPMSASALAHLGCTGCAGAINSAVTLHARVAGLVPIWSATCRVLISRIL